MAERKPRCAPGTVNRHPIKRTKVSGSHPSGFMALESKVLLHSFHSWGRNLTGLVWAMYVKDDKSSALCLNLESDNSSKIL